ncbi:MAG: SUMF1/EgtB/PvdO family nonheme iron enzyme [Flavobacteriaceae bacterium]
MGIFISYSRKDSNQADWLYDLLSYEGQHVFMDRESLNPGINWSDLTEKNIMTCDTMILLWSIHSASSAMVMREITTALMHKRKIIPCLLDLTPITPLIKEIQTMDFDMSDEFRRDIRKALNIRSHEEESNLSFEKAKSGYLKVINQEHMYLKILGKGGNYDIGDIYMPLRVRFQTGESVLYTFSADDLIQSSMNRISILGAPGAGKSTLLKYLTYNISKHNKGLPINIKISELMKTNDPLHAYISKIMNRHVGRKRGETISEHESFCRAGTVLMLDGFDEIIEADKEDFLKRLASFQTAHPDCMIIVTSRYSGYIAIEGFEVGRMEELSEEDIESYIREACDAHEWENVWSLIRNDARIFELAKTPFLLAMMVSSPDALGHRATQRALIFKSCISYLLKEADWEESPRRRKREVTENLSKVLLLILKKIAVRFYKLDSNESFMEEEVLFTIKGVMDNSMSQLKILNLICDYTGLLQRMGKELYFIHRSIWEYFVAEGMRDENLDNIIVRANIHIWEEPIRLFVGLTPERDLEEVLSKLWKENKGLALRAMTDLSFFPKDLLEKLLLNLTKDERLNVITQLEENLLMMNNTLNIKRTLLDTLSPLLQIERNSQVVYRAVRLLEEYNETYDFPEVDRLIKLTLDLDNSEQRMRNYLNSPEFKLAFVCVPKGQYWMGTDRRSRTPDERPEHCVELNDFCISIFPVTNKLYYDSFPFVESDRREERSHHDDQPVVYVTWYDAYLFAKWLGCEIPTEAQWEYACRSGGDDDEIFYDSSKIADYAWYIENSGNTTHKVGQLRPNSMGVYDMLGNVREWCHDWFSPTYYGECHGNGVVKDPKGVGSTGKKVLRGGCFDWNAANLVPTYRNYNPPSNSYFANGFRLVYNKDIETLNTIKNDEK